MTPRSVARTSAFRASSSSWRIWDTRTHSCASPVAPSLIPRGLSRTTSRPSSTERPARWTSAANASSADVLRMPWDPMKAIFAGRGHAFGGGAAVDLSELRARGTVSGYADHAPAWAAVLGAMQAVAASHLKARRRQSRRRREPQHPVVPAAGGSMRRPAVRRVIAVALPLMVLATMVCILVVLVAQQTLRAGANDPQLAMAGDAADALDRGASPTSVVPHAGARVASASSLSAFTVVFGPGQTVLATDGRLDGGDPIPPIGVLDHARDVDRGANVVTWQPRQGVRIATVTVPWNGGTVLVGRSLREVERRVDQLSVLVTVVWLLMLGVIVAASALGVAVWRGGDVAQPES